MGIARELIDVGYNPEKYRAAYGYPNYRICPPSLDAEGIALVLLPT